MAKKNLHPEIYKTKVFCAGKFIFEIETTRKELNVDIWAGNHPFYTESQQFIDTEGRVEKYKRKYKNAPEELLSSFTK